MDISNNVNNYEISETSENQILSSYMNFVNTSNNSIHHMIDIIDQQQSSFNEILSRYSQPERLANRMTNEYPRDPAPVYTNSTSNFRYNRNSYTRNYNNNRFSRYNNQNSIPSNNIANRPNPLREYFTRPRVPSYSSRNGSQYFNNIISYILENGHTESSIPTTEQVSAATEQLTFSNIENPINFSCSISHADFTDNSEVVQIKHCKHIFSADIFQWFERNCYCPLCRYDIRENIESEYMETIPRLTPTPIPIMATDFSNNSLVHNIANIISAELANNGDFSGNVSIDVVRLPHQQPDLE